MKTPDKLLAWSLVAVLAVGALGCDSNENDGPQTFLGAPVTIGNGSMRSFVTLDEAGAPVTVGVSISEAAFTGLPDAFTPFTVSLPKQAAVTPYDHLSVDWEPHGHEPNGIYTVPHFDVHFYTITTQEKDQIQGGLDDVVVPAANIPKDYMSTVQAVPKMGTHWIDSTAAELHGHAFDKTFIYGFYRGKMVFMEPMVTKALLETKTTVTVPIKQPTSFQRTGLYYPERYTIRHDAQAKAYVIQYESFKRR